MPSFTSKSKKSKGQGVKDDEASQSSINPSDTAQNQTTDEMQQPLAAGGKADDKRDESYFDPNERLERQKVSSVEDKTVGQQEGHESIPQQESEHSDISLTEEKKLLITLPLTNRNLQAIETNGDAYSGDQVASAISQDASLEDPVGQTTDPIDSGTDPDANAGNHDVTATNQNAHSGDLDANADSQDASPQDPVGQTTDPVDSVTDPDANAQDSGGPEEELNRKKECAQAACKQMNYTDEEIKRADKAYSKKYGNKRYSAEDLAKMIMDSDESNGESGGTASLKDTGHPYEDGTPHTCEVEVHIKRCSSCINCNQQQQIKYNITYE